MALPAASSHCGAMPHATACAVSHAIGCRHLTVLLEPAMQHVGIHAMFTRRGGNGCPGLLACGDQFSLELRAVDPASACGAGARIGNLLRHGVHDGFTWTRWCWQLLVQGRWVGRTDTMHWGMDCLLFMVPTAKSSNPRPQGQGVTIAFGLRTRVRFRVPPSRDKWPKRWTFGKKQGHLFRLRCGIEPRCVLLPDDFVPAFGWL